MYESATIRSERERTADMPLPWVRRDAAKCRAGHSTITPLRGHLIAVANEGKGLHRDSI